MADLSVNSIPGDRSWSLDWSIITYPTSVAVVSFIVCLWCALPIAIRAARIFGLIDRPGGRKLHDHLTPVVGGIAILGTMIGVSLLLGSEWVNWSMMLWLVVVLAIGVADDCWELSSRLRLLLFGLTVVGIAATDGYVIGYLGYLFGPSGPVLLPPILALLFTVFAVVGAVSVVNMMDGLDGLLGSLAIVSLSALLLLSIVQPDNSGLSRIFSERDIAGVLGALSAFVLLNARIRRTHARVFLGDAGSLLIGFVLVYLLIDYSQSELISPVSALWLLGLPLIDGLAVISTRIARRNIPTSAGRDHLHHIFISRGLSVNETVAAMLVIHTMLVSIGIAANLVTIVYMDTYMLFLFAASVGFRVVCFPNEASAVFDAKESGGALPVSTNPIISNVTEFAFRGSPTSVNRHKTNIQLLEPNISLPNFDKLTITTKKKKVLLVFGTRPEAIKMAPLVLALQSTNWAESTVCVTGQHRQMLDQVLELFGVVPEYDLSIMQEGQDLTDITSKVLVGTRSVIREVHPDIVLVHGDTTTCMAAALAAYYEKVPVGHVEAGLRTGDIFSPYPEEANRRMVASLASYHFTPTEAARENLVGEGVPSNRILVTGNTGIDALLLVKEKLSLVESKYWDDVFGVRLRGNIESGERQTILVTAHRRENIGDGISNLCRAIKQLAKKYPKWSFVFPVHLNPKVRTPVYKELGNIGNVFLLPPIEYLPFVWLLDKCNLCLTDSGGVQEEAPSFGIPVLVMRNVTERPEAIKAGTARLVGTCESKIKSAIEFELTSGNRQFIKNPYGDGEAAARIVNHIEETLSSKLQPKKTAFHHVALS